MLHEYLIIELLRIFPHCWHGTGSIGERVLKRVGNHSLNCLEAILAQCHRPQNSPERQWAMGF